jgi:hypothetical protein
VDIDWDDGSPPETVPLPPGVTNFSGLSHEYFLEAASQESHTITVTITDVDAAYVSATTPITVNNVAPTVAQWPAAGSATVTRASTTLTVLGADPGGEDELTYAWTATAWPSDPDPDAYEPSFDSYNGSNGASEIYVEFSTDGEYVFSVAIDDLFGGSITVGNVQVHVVRTLTSITVTSDETDDLPGEGTCNLTAAAFDQFGEPITPESAFVWAKTGPGILQGTGFNTALYTAPDIGEDPQGAVISASTGTGTVTGKTDVTPKGELLYSVVLDGPYHIAGGTMKTGFRAGIELGNTLTFDPGLFTSGAVLALRTILFSRTDSHFASLIPPHPIGEAADMAKNADSAAKNRLFPC